MEFGRIRERLQDKLQIENCKKELQAIPCGSDDEKTLITILSEIVDIHLIYEPTDVPFQYQEEHWYENPNAKEINSALKEIASWNISGLNRARIHDFLWVVGKNYDSAIEAIQLYRKYLFTSEKFETNFIVVNRLISLKLSTSKKKTIDEDYSDLVKRVLDQSASDNYAHRYYLLKTCYEYKILQLDDLFILTENELDKFSSGSNEFRIIELFVSLFEKIYAAKKNVEIKNLKNSDPVIMKVRRKKADSLITAANCFTRNNPGTMLQYVHFIKEAVKALKQIAGTEDERKQLLKEIEVVQQDAASQIPPQTYTMDVSDSVNRILRQVNALDKEEGLCYFALFIPMISAKSMRERTIEKIEKYPLSSFFGKGILDSNGKKKAVLPDVFGSNNNIREDALLANMEMDSYINIDIDSKIRVANVKNQLQSKYEITEQDIKKIVEDSIFVPEERRIAYAKGLIAGFNNDFLTALSILMPQVDNSIRNFAEICGEVVFNVKEDGSEELKSMNAVLDLPKVKECLDEDLLFSLNTIFCSKYGLNMRNEVAHGTLNDVYFNSYQALYVWWYVFKLCYMYTKNVQYEFRDKVADKVKQVIESMES